MKITKALDVGNKYVFAIVPESAKPEEAFMDPLHAVDKNTGIHSKARPALQKQGGPSLYFPKYRAFSAIRALWRTRKGQRLSQWPQPVQFFAVRESCR